jgi:hypothetical protein
MTKATATTLRKAIQERELPHAFFEQHRDALEMQIEEALGGSSPFLDTVLGPSRVGKTMLIQALARRYPERCTNGARQVPVLVVPVPTPASPKQLPRSVLKALGAPIPKSVASNAYMFERMEHQLALAGTRVILFEEASHIVDVGTKLPPRAAGDWFKQLMDQLNMSIILFGVPRLEKLLDSNEQLRYRGGSVIRFNPYSWTVEQERRHFVACIRTYAAMFSESGWHFTFPLEALVYNVYLLSGGLVGVVSKFMTRLAMDLGKRESREISLEDCAFSASKIEVACDVHPRPFADLAVAPIKLNAAHNFVLDEAGVRARVPR